MVRRRTTYLAMLLAVSLAISACVGALPKAIQVAHIESQVVETASDAFAKLYLDDVISRDIYVRGRTAYQKWADGQTALAKSLAEWKRVGNKDSKARLMAAISAASRLADDYLRFVGQFVDLAKVKANVKGGV